jgi:rhodanese-related sulfurtransferase
MFMPVKRVTPVEAKALVDQGWTFLDVRSIPEFEAGHPSGACNVPLMHFFPGRGMSPNADFQKVVEQKLDKGLQIVVGCKSGGRSLRAAEMMQAWGYASVVDMRGGFDGERDMSGRAVVPGWKDSGLPVETAAPGRTYEDLQK